MGKRKILGILLLSLALSPTVAHSSNRKEKIKERFDSAMTQFKDSRFSTKVALASGAVTITTFVFAVLGVVSIVGQYKILMKEAQKEAFKDRVNLIVDALKSLNPKEGAELAVSLYKDGDTLTKLILIQAAGVIALGATSLTSLGVAAVSTLFTVILNKKASKKEDTRLQELVTEVKKEKMLDKFMNDKLDDDGSKKLKEAADSKLDAKVTDGYNKYITLKNAVVKESFKGKKLTKAENDSVKEIIKKGKKGEVNPWIAKFDSMKTAATKEKDADKKKIDSALISKSKKATKAIKLILKEKPALKVYYNEKKAEISEHRKNIKDQKEKANLLNEIRKGNVSFNLTTQNDDPAKLSGYKVLGEGKKNNRIRELARKPKKDQPNPHYDKNFAVQVSRMAKNQLQSGLELATLEDETAKNERFEVIKTKVDSSEMLNPVEEHLLIKLSNGNNEKKKVATEYHKRQDLDRFKSLAKKSAEFRADNNKDELSIPERVELTDAIKKGVELYTKYYKKEVASAEKSAADKREFDRVKKEAFFEDTDAKRYIELKNKKKRTKVDKTELKELVAKSKDNKEFYRIQGRTSNLLEEAKISRYIELRDKKKNTKKKRTKTENDEFKELSKEAGAYIKANEKGAIDEANELLNDFEKAGWDEGAFGKENLGKLKAIQKKGNHPVLKTYIEKEISDGRKVKAEKAELSTLENECLTKAGLVPNKSNRMAVLGRKFGKPKNHYDCLRNAGIRRCEELGKIIEATGSLSYKNQLEFNTLVPYAKFSNHKLGNSDDEFAGHKTKYYARIKDLNKFDKLEKARQRDNNRKQALLGLGIIKKPSKYNPRYLKKRASAEYNRLLHLYPDHLTPKKKAQLCKDVETVDEITKLYKAKFNKKKKN